jgi:hypothetical protein
MLSLLGPVLNSGCRQARLALINNPLEFLLSFSWLEGVYGTEFSLFFSLSFFLSLFFSLFVRRGTCLRACVYFCS